MTAAGGEQRLRRWVAAAVLALWALAAEAGPPTTAEANAAFRIVRNVKEDLVERCIYRPSEAAVFTGALNELQRELDPEDAPYFPPSMPTKGADAWRAYKRAIEKLASATGMEKRSVKDLAEQSLRAYCNKLDRYSGYDDRESWEREKALKKTTYVGAGMSLERTREGFDCYPFPGGPADLAGCLSGDRLLEVEGTSVHGKTAVEVASLFPGPEHSHLRLKVRHPSDGKDEVLDLKRERISAAFISIESDSAGPVVRLRWFNDETVRQLRDFLRTIQSGKPLAIDLRGCHGGELKAAVAVAELFLPAEATICKIETRTGSEVFKSANKAPFRAKPLVILQDKGTMSGAELVTVALVKSPVVQAESRGERTYGKGVTLAEVEVDEGGGRLRFAEGRIYGPNGEFWDTEGLAPKTELNPKAQ